MTAPDPVALRVGIVGCGSIARSHARAYAANPRAELVGVHDIVPEHAQTYADEFGTTAYGSIASWPRRAPELVTVATPPGSHTAVTVALLEAGCSVLLEKPPTINLADLDVLAAAEAASAGSVYVVFQHRHGSGARRAHRLLTDGILGRPQVAVCETLWYRPDSYFLPDWRGNWAGEGGGPTLGHGIHQLDLLLHLMGPWTSVTAQSARIARPVEFEDVSLGMINFAGGAVGTIITSLLSPRELSRIRIDTTGGTLEVDHVYGYRDADWSWSPTPDAADAASWVEIPVCPPTAAPARRPGQTRGPPAPTSTGRATTPPRSTDWSTTCWPSVRTTPPWRPSVRRWSWSPRSTRRRSSGRPYAEPS